MAGAGSTRRAAEGGQAANWRAHSPAVYAQVRKRHGLVFHRESPLVKPRSRRRRIHIGIRCSKEHRRSDVQPAGALSQEVVTRRAVTRRDHSIGLWKRKNWRWARSDYRW